MRISDWSSDVCSSDLGLMREFERAGGGWFWETDRYGQFVYVSPTVAAKLGRPLDDLLGRPFTEIIKKRIGNDENEARTLGFSLSSRTPFNELTVRAAVTGEERWCDRKSGGSGKSVSVRVHLGGSRIAKKKIT